MEIEEIEKALAEFKSGLKPVEPGITTIVPEAEPAELVTEEELAVPIVAVAEEGEACIRKEFKAMVWALDPSYIGNGVKEFVLDFLGQIPECEVKL